MPINFFSSSHASSELNHARRGWDAFIVSALLILVNISEALALKLNSGFTKEFR